MSKDKFQDKYRIESARAKWHDYDNGFYFVTICTKKFTFRKCRNGMRNKQTIVALCRNSSNQAVSNALCEAE